jgi:ABC-2 type transport system permease protein
VALDLVRPLDYQLARFAEALGYLGVELVTVVVVGETLTLSFGGVAMPGGIQAVLFGVSLAAVVPLKFGIVYLTGVVCFWTQNYQGVSWARVAVSGILSGALVPLAFYPPWLRWLCEVSPFPSIVSTPALVYLGRAQGGEAVRLIAVQLGWVAVLWCAARLAWHRGLRQITVHGG